MATKEQITSHMLIVCGPSGTGKSTLLGHLLSHRSTCCLSRSTTTRAPRGTEQNGVEYDFVDVETFKAKIEADEFAEYANVFGNYYGTPHEMIRSTVEDKGMDVLFDIDVQGARIIKSKYPGVWCVLIAPPSMDVLEKRLRSRATDAPEVIERRLNTARHELAQTDLFDFRIVNDDLDTACREICALYDTLRLRTSR